jgi:predicted MPP superfamily phosphohydrolase
MKKKYSLITFIIVLCVTIYTYLHTNTLVVTHHEISIRNKVNQLRIAHISDLHTSGFNTLEKQMIKALKDNKPDIIIMTGDFASQNGDLNGYDEVLSKLSAPMGVYFVNGNWEYWAPITQLQQLFERHKIKDLTNKVHNLDDHIILSGFDDSETGRPKNNLNSVKKYKESIIISLFHSPIFFEKIADEIDLAFAGHSHGGQLRIPFFGSVWLPPGSGKYDQGWWSINKAKMYVSRGIGTSLLPIRFNCSPELAFINLRY